MTHPLSVKRIHFPTIDSTNTWAKKNAPSFERTVVTLVTADHQTAGRGRFKRHWVSPPHVNIYATFCFFLPALRPDMGNLAQVLAMSTATVLQNQGLQPKIHWPNDILASGKKIAGILCETTPVNKDICVILGIGVNINMSPEELAKIDRPATSVACELGHQCHVETILQELQHQFCKDLAVFVAQGFSPFFEQFVQLLTLKEGKNLKINDFQKIYEGTFHSINPNGSVNVVLSTTHEIRTFLAGEIL